MKQIPFEFARLPTVFFDFCPADKKNKTYRYPWPMAKKIENYNCEIRNVVSAREFDWQFLTKGLKSSPINRIQKSDADTWRPEQQLVQTYSALPWFPQIGI